MAIDKNAIEIWVAAKGSAPGDGTKLNPYRTIAEAQAAVRHVLESGTPLDRDIVVTIGGGTYALQDTLVFTAADSGKDGHVVHYRAASGERPVLTGGSAVTGWSQVQPADLHGLVMDPGVQLWQAGVAPGTDTRQLYVDGVRALRSETNADSAYPVGFRPTYFDKKDTSGIEYVVSGKNSANWSDPTTWTNVSDIEAVVYDQWKMASVPLKNVLAPSPAIPSVDPVNAPVVGLIEMQDPAWTNANVFRGLAAGFTVKGSQTIEMSGTLAVDSIAANMPITGTGIAAGTVVQSVDSVNNTITISKPATETTQHDKPEDSPTQFTIITDPVTEAPAFGQPGIWSFWRVNKFTNAFQFVNEANEWYLDRATNTLYLALKEGVDPNGHDIQLPTLETFIQGNGASNLSFEGLTFRNATWLGPNSADGYVSDQAGFHLVGTGHEPNSIGHVQSVTRSPGNVSFKDGKGITLAGNVFEHLGGAAVDFSGGAQDNVISNNIFQDVSGSAVQIGGVSALDARPATDSGIVRNNLVDSNFIKNIGAEYYDTAGIFVGFAQNTKVTNNFISDVPWSGVSLGWGWGLMDQWLSPTAPGVNLGSFPGLDGANPGMWGFNTTPTIMGGNQIVGNTITRFLQKSWDGGAIYTTGFQDGNPADLGLDGTLIAKNYAYDKDPRGGGNIFYTDGGSRSLELKDNISFGNAVGNFNFGPLFLNDDPLNKSNPFKVFPELNAILLYGSDIGGCVTYGDILYAGNRWENWWLANVFSQNPTLFPLNPLYYDPGLHGTQNDPIGHASIAGAPYPTGLLLVDNIQVNGLHGAAVPFKSPDQVLAFVKPTSVGLARTDDLDGRVSFGLQSLDDAHVETLLADASARGAQTLSYNSVLDGSWLASEGQAFGGVAAVPGQMGAGLWLPTATLDGFLPLALESLKTDGNSALATFEGGYQCSFTLGGSRSIPDATIVGDVVVTVKRLAFFQDGLAFYEADQRTGSITVDGKTLAPGDAGYLQGALAIAQAANLVIDGGQMPAFRQQATYEGLAINDTKSYGLLVLVNNDRGNLFSSFSAANPGGSMQVVSLGASNGDVTFGVEDLLVSSGLSDRDYNDLIVTLGHRPLDSPL